MSPRLGKALQGGSTVLYEEGRLDERAPRRMAITREELVAGLCRPGLDLADGPDVQRKPDASERRLPA